MNYSLFNFLNNRLSGRSISTVGASICEINSFAIRTYLLCLTSLHTTVWTKATVKLISTVFADMQENSRATRRTMLLIIIHLSSTELAGLHDENSFLMILIPAQFIEFISK
jgi:hypothetical protein